jgi:hypothetical protein
MKQWLEVRDADYAPTDTPKPILSLLRHSPRVETLQCIGVAD